MTSRAWKYVVLGGLGGLCALPISKGVREGRFQHKDPTVETLTGALSLVQGSTTGSFVSMVVSPVQTCSRCGATCPYGVTTIATGAPTYRTLFSGCNDCLVAIVDSTGVVR